MTIRIQKLQVARRTVQLLAVALILAAPILARYNNYLAAREIDKTLDKWSGTLQGETLELVDNTLRTLPDGEVERAGRMARNRERVLSYVQNLRGGPWSLEAGGVSLTDPLAGAESIAASKKVEPVLLLGLIIPVLAAVLLGRVFCAWVCPMNLLLEITDKLRGLLRFLEIRPANLRFSPAVKYVLLAVGLLGAFVLSVPILGYIYPPAMIGRELHDLVFGMFDRAEYGRFGFWAGGLTWVSLIILGVVLFEVAVSRRWWCRYVCPGGALYSLLGWLRPVRVRLDTEACSRCAACVRVCQLGLNPMKDEMGAECDNCGLCISNCADDALGYVIQIKSGSLTGGAK